MQAGLRLGWGGGTTNKSTRLHHAYLLTFGACISKTIIPIIQVLKYHFPIVFHNESQHLQPTQPMKHEASANSSGRQRNLASVKLIILQKHTEG